MGQKLQAFQHKLYTQLYVWLYTVVFGHKDGGQIHQHELSRPQRVAIVKGPHLLQHPDMQLDVRSCTLQGFCFTTIVWTSF